MKLNLRQDKYTNKDPQIALKVTCGIRSWPEKAKEGLKDCAVKINQKLLKKPLANVYGM